MTFAIGGRGEGHSGRGGHLMKNSRLHETRTNWPRKVRELILDSDSRAQGVKGYAFRVPGGQRVGFHGRTGSRGRPKRTQQVKG